MTASPTTPTSPTVEVEVKRHAACDECRTRKLKCSRSKPKCSRCEREGLRCEYSPQKQMGRPKKRRRDEDGQEDPARKSSTSQRNPNWEPTMNDLSLVHELGFGEFVGLRPAFGCDKEQHVDLNIDPALSGGPSQEPTPGSSDNLWTGLELGFEPSHHDGNLQHHLPSPGVTHSSEAYQPHDIGILTPTASNQLNYSLSPPCACLSTMYLTLSTLANMPSFQFPHILSPLRSSLAVASTVLDCPHCPLETSTMVQNVGVLNTLLTSIGDRLFKALGAIEAETARLESTSSTKQFRMGDASPEVSGIHDGTADCAGGFMVELKPQEWRKYARKALAAEAGTSPGRPHERTLSGLCERMIERQNRWHADPMISRVTEHMYERDMRMKINEMRSKEGKEHYCVTGLLKIKKMVELMHFDD